MPNDRRDIELDPRFLVPPGVVDIRQENNENSYQVYENSDDVVDATDGPVLEFPNSPIPSAPTGYSIVSQTIRIGDDGTTRVDVLLELPDNGAFDIDVRFTPA